MGHTEAAKHKIVLKDPDTPPFKERFLRIPPPQLDEVHAHLKMLDAGVIQPSNSPWCNAVGEKERWITPLLYRLQKA